jgi:hypothetical protein
MQIYLGRGGSQTGPFTLFQIHEMLASGEIDGGTLGWMPGEGGWQPIRELAPVLSLIQSIEREKLDAELAKSGRPTLPPPSSIPQQRLPSHAISRFGARMIDVLIFQMVLSYFWTLPQPPASFPQPENFSNLWEYFAAFLRYSSDANNTEHMEYAWRIIHFQLGSMLGWHLVEPAILALCSTTLGKLIFRLRVAGPDGGRPGYFRCLYRSLLVFLFGMGAGFGPLLWIANFFAFLRVQSTGVAYWDQQAHTRVDQDPVGPFRALAVLFVITAILLLDHFLS